MFRLWFCIWTLLSGLTFAAEFPTNRVDEITGLKGKWNPDEAVYKISSPRTDFKVSVDGWQMPPWLADAALYGPDLLGRVQARHEGRRHGHGRSRSLSG